MSDGSISLAEAIASYGLRPYQCDAVTAVLRELEEARSTLIVVATGLGKTQIAGALAGIWKNGDILFLAHRNELVEQARDRLEQMTGYRVEIEKAELRASNTAHIVVASVQTLQRQTRLDGIGPDRFGLIIVDEAHHYVSNTYAKPLTYFRDAKVVGLTATPDRSDGAALGQSFETVAYTMGIEDGIEQGYLVPLEALAVEVESLDISQVGKTGKDLSAGELDEAMLRCVEPIVAGCIEHGEGRTGICFFPGLRTAQLATERFNVAEPDSARFVSGGTPLEERAMIMRDFRAKRFRWLCNCQVATEGFDAPVADLIALGRPTLSRALMCQMVGRGTRVLPGIIEPFPEAEQAEQRRAAIDWSDKPACKILDFVGNAGKHSLTTPLDALAGNYTEAEVKQAKKKPGGNVLENLRAARAELRAMASSFQSKAALQVERWDPFDTLRVNRSRLDAQDEQFGRTPPTPGQVWAARSRGMASADINGLSKLAMSRLLAADKERETKGLATYSQMRALQAWGINDKSLKAENASAALNYLQKGWGFPSSLSAAEVARLARGK